MTAEGRERTPVVRAKQPCEHGMCYRGTGRVCGYCLAVHEAEVHCDCGKSYVGQECFRDN